MVAIMSTTKPRRIYINPNKSEECPQCGNDGSDIITCDSCWRRPGEIPNETLRNVLANPEVLE
jgi:hypothetical protein